jgi:hypothetical protein
MEPSNQNTPRTVKSAGENRATQSPAMGVSVASDAELDQFRFGRVGATKQESSALLEFVAPPVIESLDLQFRDSRHVWAMDYDGHRINPPFELNTYDLSVTGNDKSSWKAIPINIRPSTRNSWHDYEDLSSCLCYLLSNKEENRKLISSLGYTQPSSHAAYYESALAYAPSEIAIVSAEDIYGRMSIDELVDTLEPSGDRIADLAALTLTKHGYEGHGYNLNFTDVGFPEVSHSKSFTKKAMREALEGVFEEVCENAALVALRKPAATLSTDFNLLVEKAFELPGNVYIKPLGLISDGSGILKVSSLNKGKVLIESDCAELSKQLRGRMWPLKAAGKLFKAKNTEKQKTYRKTFRSEGEAQEFLKAFLPEADQVLSDPEKFHVPVIGWMVEEEISGETLKNGSKVEFRFLLSSGIQGLGEDPVESYAKVSKSRVSANISLGASSSKTIDALVELYEKRFPEKSTGEHLLAAEELSKQLKKLSIDLAEKSQQRREDIVQQAKRQGFDVDLSFYDDLTCIDMSLVWNSHEQDFTPVVIEMQYSAQYTGLRKVDPEAAERLEAHSRAVSKNRRELKRVSSPDTL